MNDTYRTVPPTMQTALQDKPKPKTSGMAIASVVCGILGACTFIPSLIGIVLGIVALNQISKSNGKKGGQGVAITGIVVSCATLIVFLFGALMAGIMLPAINAARELAAQAKQDAQMLAQAQDLLEITREYEQDNGVLPDADGWELTLFTIPLRGLDDPEGIPWVAMNRAVGGLPLDSITDPSNTVLYFEVPAGSRVEAGGPDELANGPSNLSGFLIIFVEGEPRFVPFNELDTLVWEP